MRPQPCSFRSTVRLHRRRTGALPLLIAGALIAGHSAWAQDPGPSADALSRVFPKAPYSPFANRDFPNQPLWGDTHLHTGLSMDAGAFRARLMPDDVYKFARGVEVVSSTGQRVRLSNEQGEVVLTLRVTTAVRLGTLYVPKGSWLRTSETGQTINALIPGHRTDLGDGACYNDAQVDIRPAVDRRSEQTAGRSA